MCILEERKGYLNLNFCLETSFSRLNHSWLWSKWLYFFAVVQWNLFICIRNGMTPNRRPQGAGLGSIVYCDSNTMLNNVHQLDIDLLEGYNAFRFVDTFLTRQVNLDTRLSSLSMVFTQKCSIQAAENSSCLFWQLSTRFTIKPEEQIRHKFH